MEIPITELIGSSIAAPAVVVLWLRMRAIEHRVNKLVERIDNLFDAIMSR